MLQRLRTGLGFRVAIIAAAMAALCFVAPPAVLAFGHGSDTVQCLTHADAVDHDHGVQGGLAHQDHDGRAKLPGGHHDPNCCGLFCMSALAPAAAPLVEGRFGLPALIPLVETTLLDRTPDLPHRPPIAALDV
jgi:hypothetical protein